MHKLIFYSSLSFIANTAAATGARIPGFHSGSRDVEGVEGLMWGGCPQETCEFSIEELRVGAFSYAVELNLSP